MVLNQCVFRRKVGFWIRGPPSVGALLCVEGSKLRLSLLLWGHQNTFLPCQQQVALAPDLLAVGHLRPAPQLVPCTLLQGPGEQEPWFAVMPFGMEIGNPGGSCSLFRLCHIGQGISLFRTLKLLSSYVTFCLPKSTCGNCTGR